MNQDEWLRIIQSTESTQSQHSPQPAKPDNSVAQLDDASHPPLAQDPWLHLPVIGIGMTGIIYAVGESRVVKKPKQSRLPDPGDAEYMNDMNRKILENEIQVFKRLGNHDGIIECFHLSQYGVELARAHGDLEDHIKNYPEPAIPSKIAWILSLTETFSYIHSRRVFVDYIALRNILVLDGQLKVADFGQSILLPLEADITTVTENDLNIRIEILHIGWILYSIASWTVHKYYFFTAEEPDLSQPVSFLNVDDVLCGKIIEKCWRGGYANTDHLRIDALELLADQSPAAVRESKE